MSTLNELLETTKELFGEHRLFEDKEIKEYLAFVKRNAEKPASDSLFRAEEHGIDKETCKIEMHNFKHGLSGNVLNLGCGLSLDSKIYALVSRGIDKIIGIDLNPEYIKRQEETNDTFVADMLKIYLSELKEKKKEKGTVVSRYSSRKIWASYDIYKFLKNKRIFKEYDGENKEDVLREYQELVKSKVDYEQGDAYNLKYADGTFDYVITDLLIDIIGNPFKCMKEIHRVLKKGGNVYMQYTYNRGKEDLVSFWDKFDMIMNRKEISGFKQLNNITIEALPGFCGPVTGASRIVNLKKVV